MNSRRWGTFFFLSFLLLNGCVAAIKRPVAKRNTAASIGNRAPEVPSQVLYFDGDGTRHIELNGNDADGDPILYEIVSAPDPLLGSIDAEALSAGTVEFQSVAGVTGDIAFTVKASDGELESSIATITVHIPKITRVATGGGTTCAVVDNRAKCWGLGTKGQLGNGVAESSQNPVVVSGLILGVTEISLGAEHGCGLLNTGVMKCWGSNAKGAVGKGSVSDVEATPIKVNVSAVKAIGTGNSFSCALTNSGEVYCWGDNSKKQIGEDLGETVATPTLIQGLDSGVTALAVGGSHVCVLKSGKTYCWGSNEFGQIGIADIAVTTVGTPTLIDESALAENSVSKLTAGRSHTCAVMSDTTVKCWGRNDDGELGL